MAAAMDIVGGDEHALTWLEILDTDGVRWTFHQGGAATGQAAVHIYQHDNGKLEIMPDGAGGVLLRQHGPGLPRSINIRLAPRGSPGPGLGVAAGWGGGIYLCEQ
jgi:hypothetical protein